MLTKIFLIINTIRYLKFIQISNRIKRNFIKPKFVLFPSPQISYLVNSLQPVIKYSQRMYGADTFKFLNKEADIRLADDWNAVDFDKLWLYNLHYFDDLNSINSEQRSLWHNNLVQRWIDENPPKYQYGNGWEPYPSSLRIVNWIKWFLLNGNKKKNWTDSLAIQVRFLIQNLEFHLLGNHLLANSKALIFAGLFFKGEEADNWYQIGINILNKELSEQILLDGGDYELSPMYHSILLEDLLDLINIHQAYGRGLLIDLESTTEEMFGWLRAMCHPDGQIAFFNDSTLGVSPTLAELSSYAKRLNILKKNHKFKGLTHLKNSGYIRVDKENVVLIADIADIGPKYIPGHGHADALSFEMSLFANRVIVNSGISTYEIGDERHKQRGTASHSTIIVDDKNSSEVWRGFRVARRAKVLNVKAMDQNNNVKFSAFHDGYKRLKKSVFHYREWSVFNFCIEINDKVTGKGSHKISSILPLHPDVNVISIGHDCAILKIINKRIKVNFEGEGVLRVSSSYYHQEFGMSLANKQLIYDYNGELPFKSKIKISW